MPAESITHPDADTLAAYVRGVLDKSAAELISSHLDGCPDCRKTIGLDLPVGPGTESQIRLDPLPPAFLAGAAELAGMPDYTVIRKLGQGGMGAVYLARNTLAGKDYALKVICPAFLARPGAEERFRREIQAAIGLGHHPNIVQAHTAFRHGESLILAMEFVVGKTLDGEIQDRFGPIPIAHACSYAAQAALGLQHAHDRGLVHRDVKPSNLILTRVGNKRVVKVLDFGLVRPADVAEIAQVAPSPGTTGDPWMTAAGSALGTPDYMAPEQARNAAAADARADIYSLGCTLYHLLTGRPPFPDGTGFEKMIRHFDENPTPIQDLRPDVPDELAAVLRRMMAKDPATRYPTARETAQALAPFTKVRPDRLVLSPPVMAPSLSPETVVDQPVPSSTSVVIPDVWQDVRGIPSPARTNRRWFRGVLPAILVAVALVAVWAGWQSLVGGGLAELTIENLPLDAEVLVDGHKVDPHRAGRTATLPLRPEPHALRIVVGLTELYANDREEISPRGTRIVLGKTPSMSRTVTQETRAIPQPAVAPASVSKPSRTASPPTISSTISSQATGVPLTPPPRPASLKPGPEQDEVFTWQGESRSRRVLSFDLGGQTILEVVRIPAGTFFMGSSQADRKRTGVDRAGENETPRHRVTFPKDFYIGKFEVTRGQFARFADTSGYRTEAERDGVGGYGYRAGKSPFEGPNPRFSWRAVGAEQTDRHPVVNVTAADAAAFCDWLTMRSEREVRLPTESEWEFACRGGTQTRWFTGDDPATLAGYANLADRSARMHFPVTGPADFDDGQPFAAPVGSFRPNRFGLHDMTGNVAEWCRDRLVAYSGQDLQGAAVVAPLTASQVYRGGSWDVGPARCRSACRDGNVPSSRITSLGFRVVVVAPE